MSLNDPESKIPQAQPKEGLETGSLQRPEESRIKQAQPKEGLETGSLRAPGAPVGPEQSDEQAEAAVANAYALDLSGGNGALAQFRAVREIAEKVSKGNFRSMVVSSANGSLHGSFPFYVLDTRNTARSRPNTTPPSAEDAGVKQWTLRMAEGVPQIRSGALYGLGFSGFNLGDFFGELGWAPDEWVGITEGHVYLKLFIKVLGAPYTYYSSPDQAETVYLPSQVDDARVELHIFSFDDDLPDPVQPTIDPQSGDPDVEGEYYLRIGVLGVGPTTNDFSGPLGIGWCPPENPYLVELTS